MKHIVLLDQILSKTIIFILPSHWSDPPTLAGVIWTFLFLVKIFIILTYFRWAFLKWLKIVKKGPQNQNKWPWYEEKTLIFQFSSKKHVIRISILHTSKSPLLVILMNLKLEEHLLLVSFLFSLRFEKLYLVNFGLNFVCSVQNLGDCWENKYTGLNSDQNWNSNWMQNFLL